MKPGANLHGFYDEQQQQAKKVINGPRPSPLMINKDSHLIRKPPVKGPIIIYTQSPKIIHTKAQDFMALVQRLTGMSKENSSTTVASASENFGSSLSDGSNNNSSIKKEEEMQWMMQQGVSHDVDETSSALRREGETCIKGGAHSPSVINMNFADMPLFTPTASYDFFCSSRPMYKFSDSPYGILGSLMSPSGLGFIKDLPEY